MLWQCSRDWVSTVAYVPLASGITVGTGTMSYVVNVPTHVV